MSESIDVPAAYARLTDSIFRVIEYSTEAELAPARALMRRIRTRDLYAYVGETLVPPYLSATLNPDTIADQVMSHILKGQAAGGGGGTERREEEEVTPSPLKRHASVTEETPAGDSSSGGPALVALPAVPAGMQSSDIIVDIVTLNYGKGRHNPVDSVRFYQRGDDVTVLGGLIPREKVSTFIPQHFQERYIRVYTRHAELADAARFGFERWCAEHVKQLPTPMATPKKRGRSGGPHAGPVASLLFPSQSQ